MYEMDQVNMERKKVIAFLTERLGLSAIHPEADCTQWPGQENSATPVTNCLRIPYTDALQSSSTHLQDLINLVNRVQIHKCKLGYCLKYDENGVLQQCRFKYPRKLVGFQAIFEEQDESLLVAILRIVGQLVDGAGFVKGELLNIRNHDRLVETIPEILTVWRGNTDAQLIKSLQHLMEYVLKYIMKPETGSKTFTQTVHSVTREYDENSPIRKLFGRILLKTLNEHDISRREAFRIFSPNYYVMTSRPLRSVNVLGTRQVVDNRESDDTAAVKENLADKYWNRESDDNYHHVIESWEEGKFPRHPSNVSLYQFVSCFNTNWTLSNRLYVPHTTPSFYYPPNKSNTKYHANYCRTMLLLHKPGTNPTNLKHDSVAEMAEFVDSEFCPVTVKQDFTKTMYDEGDPALEKDVIDNDDQLLPDPLNRQEPTVMQDDGCKSWVDKFCRKT